MIANFFKKSKPAGIILIIGLLFIYYFFATFYVSANNLSINLFGNILILFVLGVIWVLVFNFIVSKNKLTLDNLYGLLLGVIFLGTFYESMFSSKLLLTNILLLLAFRKIYSLSSNLNTKMKLFDVAFWIGIASLIYFWSFLFFILIYVGIILYKKVSIRNLIIPIVGFITPIFLYFTYCFYLNKLPLFYQKFDINFSLDFNYYSLTKYLLPLILISLMIIWSIIRVTPSIVLVSNKLKQKWILLLNHLVVAIIVVGLSEIKNGSELLFLIFPAAIIIANFIPKLKSSLFKNVIIYLFLALSISVYFL
ncbi:DUF6427 family protein [Lutibacter sp.]|uniref:DUF6427 family protein n=1 Tax=Lutibacter sp. TaxID=1925666 RepID=UPI0025C525E0|nr:DUF6427 family protein [Lutibacter sp.]MCF6180550.1 DUF6427 family protein [Lutibacter sp.]